MFDKVEKLSQVTSTGDKRELVMLNNGMVQRMTTYNTSPTAAHLKDWQAAKEALRECVERLFPAYFPDEAAPTDPQQFDRQKDARDYLVAKGYKVSSGKFSSDWNNGKVKVYQGRVSLAALLEYATTLDVDHKRIATAEARQARKDSLEIEKLEIDIEAKKLANRKEDAKWVLKVDATDQSAAILVLLRDNLRHHASVRTAAAVLAAGGDPSRASEVEDVLQSIISDGFNDLAGSREARLIGLVDGSEEEEED